MYINVDDMTKHALLELLAKQSSLEPTLLELKLHLQHERTEEEGYYLDQARDLYHRDGELEIEDEGIVSDSDEGAYVQAWVWVTAPEPNDPEQGF